MRDRHRLSALESAATGHCPRCANLPPLVRVECDDDRLTRHREPRPPLGSGMCPECGRDRMVVVKIVLVPVEVPDFGGQRL